MRRAVIILLLFYFLLIPAKASNNTEHIEVYTYKNDTYLLLRNGSMCFQDFVIKYFTLNDSWLYYAFAFANSTVARNNSAQVGFNEFRVHINATNASLSILIETPSTRILYKDLNIHYTKTYQETQKEIHKLREQIRYITIRIEQFYSLFGVTTYFAVVGSGIGISIAYIKTRHTEYVEVLAGGYKRYEYGEGEEENVGEVETSE